MGRDIATNLGTQAVWLMSLYLGYNREYIEENLGTIQEAMSTVVDDPESLKGYIGQSYACEGHNTLDLLDKITSETLVILGETDLIASPKRSKVLAEQIPDSVLKVFSGVGHGFWREKQQEVDDLVLNFLLR